MAQFYPDQVPEEYSKEYFRIQLELIRQSIVELEAASVRFDELWVAPKKPEDRTLYFADGSHWNPGAGRGLYVYMLGEYHKIGGV